MRFEEHLFCKLQCRFGICWDMLGAGVFPHACGTAMIGYGIRASAPHSGEPCQAMEAWGCAKEALCQQASTSDTSGRQEDPEIACEGSNPKVEAKRQQGSLHCLIYRGARAHDRGFGGDRQAHAPSH